MKIWIDADACPNMVKEIVFKASHRTRTPVCLVANSYIAVPIASYITAVKVAKGADIADFYIIDKVNRNDLVITADIPLAALVVAKGAVVIDPRGTQYTEENVRQRLSMRDFMQELRDGGLVTGGPPALSAKDSARFAKAFDSALAKLLASKP